MAWFLHTVTKCHTRIPGPEWSLKLMANVSFQSLSSISSTTHHASLSNVQNGDVHCLNFFFGSSEWNLRSWARCYQNHFIHPSGRRPLTYIRSLELTRNIWKNTTWCYPEKFRNDWMTGNFQKNKIQLLCANPKKGKIIFPWDITGCM